MADAPGWLVAFERAPDLLADRLEARTASRPGHHPLRVGGHVLLGMVHLVWTGPRDLGRGYRAVRDHHPVRQPVRWLFGVGALCFGIGISVVVLPLLAGALAIGGFVAGVYAVCWLPLAGVLRLLGWTWHDADVDDEELPDPASEDAADDESGSVPDPFGSDLGVERAVVSNARTARDHLDAGRRCFAALRLAWTAIVGLAATAVIGLSWGLVVGGTVVVVAFLVALVLVLVGLPTGIAVNPVTRGAVLLVVFGPLAVLPLYYGHLAYRELRGG